MYSLYYKKATYEISAHGF